MKTRLLNNVIETLNEADFHILKCTGIRSCFDVFAKRKETLIIKVLVNIEGLNRRSAMELKRVGMLTSSIPIVVGEHMKNTRLSSGVIYTRYDVHVVNSDTLKDIVSDRFPSMYSVRGDYCVRINSELLTDLRRKLGMTQQRLASTIGVSKQSIHRYESSGRISLDIAQRLMKILEYDIALPSDIHTNLKTIDEDFEMPLNDLKKKVLNEFKSIGFETSLTNAPFNMVVAGSRHKILTIVSDDRRNLKRRVEIITELSEIIKTHKMCISNRHQDVDMLVMRPKELEKVTGPKELIEILESS